MNEGTESSDLPMAAQVSSLADQVASLTSLVQGMVDRETTVPSSRASPPLAPDQAVGEEEGGVRRDRRDQDEVAVPQNSAMSYGEAVEGAQRMPSGGGVACCCRFRWRYRERTTATRSATSARTSGPGPGPGPLVRAEVVLRVAVVQPRRSSSAIARAVPLALPLKAPRHQRW